MNTQQSSGIDIEHLVLGGIGGYYLLTILVPIMILVIMLTLFWLSLKLTDVTELLKSIDENSSREPMDDQEYALYLKDKSKEAETDKKHTRTFLVALLGVMAGSFTVLMGLSYNNDDLTSQVLYVAGGLIAATSIIIPAIRGASSSKTSPQKLDHIDTE